jgi:recombination protein RecR
MSAPCDARGSFPVSLAYSPLIAQLVDALRTLQGVGPKSAQRMAMQLLQRNRPGALRLAAALTAACEGVGQCQRCRNLAESPLCALCSNPKRDRRLLCIVETPADVLALEQSGSYTGTYFVLHGRLSPLDGIGPNELGLDQLVHYLAEAPVEELIIATNPTMEGEATAHYIAQLTAPFGLKLSRIAHGVPLGGELEYIDGGTLAHALASRRPLQL